MVGREVHLDSFRLLPGHPKKGPSSSGGSPPCQEHGLILSAEVILLDPLQETQHVEEDIVILLGTPVMGRLILSVVFPQMFKGLALLLLRHSGEGLRNSLPA